MRNRWALAVRGTTPRAAPGRPSRGGIQAIGTLITIDPEDELAIAGAGEQVATSLAAGGVAILPAEGLYGLHASQNSAAGIARLRALKRDTRGRPYILIVADLDAARGLMQAAAPAAIAAQRWMERAWPAPVTFVVPAGPAVAPELAPAGLVALRCPDSRLLRAVASRMSAAVLSTSANAGGQPPPARVDEISPALREASDLIVDGGTLSGRGSTVARVERDGSLTILRPGGWTPPPAQPAIGETP